MSIFSGDVTYSNVINTAATLLYNQLKNYSLNSNLYKQIAQTFHVGTTDRSTTHQYITVTANINTINYSPPSLATIKNDMTNFLKALSIPTGASVVEDGMAGISLLYALQFFISKSVKSRVISQSNNVNVYYSPIPAAQYDPVRYSTSTGNLINNTNMSEIYNTLLQANLKNGNITSAISGASTAMQCSSCSSSSCSSSSCSSSSCSSSSSWFIAFFNLR